MGGSSTSAGGVTLSSESKIEKGDGAMTQPIEDFQPETIKFERQGGIGIVTLNRPHRLNAMNLQMVRELRRVVDYVERDDAMLVLIFTGVPGRTGAPASAQGLI